MQKFAVIFDFNGTMLFDTPLQLEAWSRLLEETQGRSIAKDEFLRCTNGRTSRETVQHFWGAGLSAQQQDVLIERKRELYRQLCMEHPERFHLVNGLPDVLDLLKKYDIPFTIATSSSPRSVDFYFEHLGLGQWFDRGAVVCSDRNFPGKPAPDIYRIAARQLNTPPEACMVVEDALAGAYAARGAGIGFIVVIDPEDTGLIWVGNEVHCVIHAYDELERMLRAILAEK